MLTIYSNISKSYVLLHHTLKLSAVDIYSKLTTQSKSLIKLNIKVTLDQSLAINSLYTFSGTSSHIKFLLLQTNHNHLTLLN